VFEKFDRQAKETVKRAQRLAADDGASTVEAEHLLLALTERSSERTARALAKLGLTPDAVRAGLVAEYADALGMVGVSAIPSDRPTRATTSHPRWGQSAKLTLTRTLQVALDRGQKRLDDRHLLLALTQAEAGVMPRLLQILEVTPSEIDQALR
jgi:ATP-dependent Clp protease ATP-binding subunit ClpA